MDEFERELKLGFLDEAASSLEEVETSFISLESNPNDSETIDKIFRLAHNLKGSSRAVGFEHMGKFTHEFETLLLKFKNKELPVTAEVVNLFLRCGDHLNQMIVSLRENFDAVISSDELLNEINQIKSGEIRSDETKSNNVASEEVEEISLTDIEKAKPLENEVSTNEQELTELKNDIAADEINSLLVNEVIPVKKISEPEVKPVGMSSSSDTKPSSSNSKAASSADESVRVNVSKLQKLMDYIGEMVIFQSVLTQQAFANGDSVIKKTVHQMSKVSKELQDISMSLRMVPIKSTFQKMQRIVRDTSIALGKEVKLELHGEDTELDKSVLEKLNDPLVHLVRNSVDHGVEDIQTRFDIGKPTTGVVKLAATQRAGRLVISISDDGAGLNPEKLKKKAIEKGIIKKDAQLTEKECFQLIFAPGFSTKEVVTDVSGRGVGMDVVKTNIASLSGDIQIESEIGKGTTFIISLPLTLSIIDGMVIKSLNQNFVFPLTSVNESMKIKKEDLDVNQEIGEILNLRGENLPVYYFHKFLGSSQKLDIENYIGIVIRNGKEPFVMMVDDIINQSQIVIKPLGSELQYLKGVLGSTILGDGKPSLIIEPHQWIQQKNIKPTNTNNFNKNLGKTA